MKRLIIGIMIVNSVLSLACSKSVPSLKADIRILDSTINRGMVLARSMDVDSIKQAEHLEKIYVMSKENLESIRHLLWFHNSDLNNEELQHYVEGYETYTNIVRRFDESYNFNK